MKLSCNCIDLIQGCFVCKAQSADQQISKTLLLSFCSWWWLTMHGAQGKCSWLQPFNPMITPSQCTLSGSEMLSSFSSQWVALSHLLSNLPGRHYPNFIMHGPEFKLSFLKVIQLLLLYAGSVKCLRMKEIYFGCVLTMQGYAYSIACFGHSSLQIPNTWAPIGCQSNDWWLTLSCFGVLHLMQAFARIQSWGTYRLLEPRVSCCTASLNTRRIFLQNPNMKVPIGCQGDECHPPFVAGILDSGTSCIVLPDAPGQLCSLFSPSVVFFVALGAFFTLCIKCDNTVTYLLAESQCLEWLETSLSRSGSIW